MLLYIEMSSYEGIVGFLKDLYSICLNCICRVDAVALTLHQIFTISQLILTMFIIINPEMGFVLPLLLDVVCLSEGLWPIATVLRY